MAVLYEWEAKGDPANLLQQYDQAGQAFRQKGNQFRQKGNQSEVIAHICIETPDGIKVLDLIESPAVEAAAPHGRGLPRGQAVTTLQQHGLVDQSQRDAVRNAGLLNANYSEAVYRVHDFAVIRTK